MLAKTEYDSYRARVESDEVRGILSSMSPDDISKLGGEMSIYYARISGELADVKDAMLGEFMRLTSTDLGGVKGLSAAQAGKESEFVVNASRQVSRRQIDYLMKALDKISFACSARVRSFSKEGHF